MNAWQPELASIQKTTEQLPSLSIIVPLYREAENVPPLLEKLVETLNNYQGKAEIILVDDGSDDGTGDALVTHAQKYEANIHVICLRRNFGQTMALQIGIDVAQGELIATLDGDLQNDPTEIPALVTELLTRDLDILQGWRQQRQDDWLRSWASRLANGLIARTTGLHLHDNGCSLKVYRADVLRQIELQGMMHRFIPVWATLVTSPQRIGETPVHHYPRTHGQSKYGFGRIIPVLADLFTISFMLRYAHRPGHFFIGCSIFFAVLGTIMLAWYGLAFQHVPAHNQKFIVGSILWCCAFFSGLVGLVAELLIRQRPNKMVQRKGLIYRQIALHIPESLAQNNTSNRNIN